MDFDYYHNNPKYWDRQAWANSVDLDQMYDQSLHCLSLIKLFLDTLTGCQMELFSLV